MKKLRFEEIKNTLINNMRSRSLIPIIGSGFTSKCGSFHGNVPAGKTYKEYMIDKIIKSDLSLSQSKDQLKKETFSSVSSIYHKVVPRTEQENYLRNNFTQVTIEKDKKDFLSLPWAYIYTLNIDDGIERNSQYNQVIYANRKFNEQIFDDQKCIIKLHGDVRDMLAYTDSESEIFAQEQYIASLKKNKKLLAKLRNDSIYNNLLFVGCSLENEIDLLYSLIRSDISSNTTNRYICITNEPSRLQELKYEQYGITHCVIFESFDALYPNLYSVGIEAQKINIDDLDKFGKHEVVHLDSTFEANRPYLLYGKSLQGKDHAITIPYFFVERVVSSRIIANFQNYTVQLLVGSRCSGKSYILTDIAQTIRNKDVFFFESKDKLTEQSFNKLLDKTNCIILVDTDVIYAQQFEEILRKAPYLKNKNIQIVLAVNKNNRTYMGIVTMLEREGIISLKDFPQVSVDSILSSEEITKINPRLTAISAGLFQEKKTIVDNLLYISENLSANIVLDIDNIVCYIICVNSGRRIQ